MKNIGDRKLKTWLFYCPLRKILQTHDASSKNIKGDLLLGTKLIFMIICIVSSRSVFAEGDITRTGYMDAFEANEVDSILFESKTTGISLSSIDALNGKKSLLMKDSASIKTVNFNPTFTDELVCIAFKVKVKTIHGSTVDKNFLGKDEIFHVNVEEVDRVASNNAYSSKFSILKGATLDKIRFVGYDRNSIAYTDTAKDSTDVVDFLANNTYDVKLIYSRFRMYININNGKIKTSYYTGREQIKSVRLYSRLGSEVIIDDFNVYGTKNTPKAISAHFEKLITDGIFSGYTEIDRNMDGIAFSRMTSRQRILYGTSRGCAYQSGVWFDAYTNSRTIKIDYIVQENDYASGWPTQFDVFIDNVKQENITITTKKLKSYSFAYTSPQTKKPHYRLTIMFPSGVDMAITDIKLDGDSIVKSVNKPIKLLALGDSITQGAQCQSAASVYANQVALKYNMQLLNHSVSGTSFSFNKVVAGDYKGFVPDYVMLAWGTNSYAGGVGDKDKVLSNLDIEVPKNVDAIKTAFPNVKIIAITPVWRSDEAGNNFSLQDVINKLNAIYAKYPEITVLSGYNYVPHDNSYYNSGNLKIHPNTAGHIEYGTNLIRDLVSTINMTIAVKVD